jgi:cardiolipin synthase
MSGAFWGGLLLGLVILLALVVWSIRRHKDPDLHIECDRPIDELMSTLAGLTLGTAVAGNTAAVHENGAFFDVLIGRIRAARESVHFETFLWKEGALGRRLADALIDRARAGVQVRVLLDAVARGRGRRTADARRRLPRGVLPRPEAPQHRRLQRS